VIFRSCSNIVPVYWSFLFLNEIIIYFSKEKAASVISEHIIAYGKCVITLKGQTKNFFWIASPIYEFALGSLE
jgi:hypothetical protein